MTPPEQQAGAGAWLMEPEIMLPERLSRDYTIVTDGATARVARKPRYGEEHIAGQSWPSLMQHSPWLQPVPVTLFRNQTLICDGLRMWPKDRFAFESPDVVSAEEFEIEPPAPISSSVPPSSSSPPPSSGGTSSIPPPSSSTTPPSSSIPPSSSTPVSSNPPPSSSTPP